LVCGAVVVYAGGVCWLKMLSGLDWTKALTAGVLVFLPGDAVKIAAALPIAGTLRPLVAGTLFDAGDSSGNH
ncbi:MAG TPA: biotin transporter BioY, partial [Desulfosalsimonadaceae bacterium]|nr:biotin transporter BioY [Desulfosalsimonadaceae bacterium]